MYEDVCLQCGKPPSLVDGRAYCSDDCESLEATSPSISVASSTFSSPHLPDSVPALDKDIPVLLSSALGGSPFHFYPYYRKMNSAPTVHSRHQVMWSNFPDPYGTQEHDEHPTLHDDPAYQNAPDRPLSHASAVPSGLSYARKPSSTNHHSIVPLLPPRSSSGTSSPARMGIPQSAPSPVPLSPYSSGAEDELSDSSDKNSTLRLKQSVVAPSSKTILKKRNRASLPAYFSLLQPTSPSSSAKTNSSTCSILKTSHSARTPEDSMSITAPSTSAVTTKNVFANCAILDPQHHDRGRSSHRTEHSSNSRSPSRPYLRYMQDCSISRSPCPHDPVSQRGRRIDSVEKVADWMSLSIKTGDMTKVRRGSSGENWVDDHPENGERRGRRRVHELDIAPVDARGAPGFGSGRSGIKDRERRGIGLV